MKFAVGIWEGEDYVVTVRPETEPVWKAVPIGGVASKSEAHIIASWLPSAFPDLYRLFRNTSSESDENLNINATSLISHT